MNYYKIINENNIVSNNMVNNTNITSNNNKISNLDSKSNNKQDINVVICGNYGATNLGDDAILDSILLITKNAFSKINNNFSATVLFTTTKFLHTKKDFNVEMILPSGIRSFFKGIFDGRIFKTFSSLKKADLFILGGGGLFSDEKPMAIIIWAIQASFAILFKIPLICIGQSVGPLKSSFAKSVVKKIYNFSLLNIVRDKSSVEVLNNLSIDNVFELPDPVFFLTKNLNFNKKITKPTYKYCIFSIRPWMNTKNTQLSSIIANFSTHIWHKYQIKSIFVPFQEYIDNDTHEMNKILEHISLKKGKNKDYAKILPYNEDYESIINLIKGAEFICGMRLHSIIFSMMSNTPFIALSYSEKVISTVKKMNMEDFAIDLSNISNEILNEKLDLLFSTKESIKDKLKISNNNLFNDSKQYSNHLVDLLLDLKLD